MTKTQPAIVSSVSNSPFSERSSWVQRLSYFTLAVLGFSFWFFVAVPFASHRESYGWLAGVHNERFTGAFEVISITYRPLAQATTWLGFMILKPSVFPTSALRQALLQGMVYGLFILAWWLIFSSSSQPRLLSTVAFVSGGIFFSGYVHLFHIYGLFYVPVMLILGAILRFRLSCIVGRREVWLALASILLVFWHPFATALFVGFYFGFYVETLAQRNMSQHIQALAIIVTSMAAILATVFLFPRPDALISLYTRMRGFLISYQTSEVKWVASLFAFLLAELSILSMPLSGKAKLAGVLLVSAVSTASLWSGLPLILVWLSAVLVKLGLTRRWSLFFLTLAAILLPFGGGIGAPVFALFAIVVASYVTPLGWSGAETSLSFLRVRYIAVFTFVAVVLVVMVREGGEIPVVTKAASLLLTERERTYQLERILAWLHRSEYCGDAITFSEGAGSPIDSVENMLTRRNRPPAGLGDVQLFWDTVLRCRGRAISKAGTAIVTFGVPALRKLRPVFEIKGRYAGEAIVWIENSSN
jgi:hypothetical protein